MGEWGEKSRKEPGYFYAVATLVRGSEVQNSVCRKADGFIIY